MQPLNGYGAISRWSERVEESGPNGRLGSKRRRSQPRCRVRFHAQAEDDLHCWYDSEHQREPSPSKDDKAWAEAVIQRSTPCVKNSCGSDLCVGTYVEAAAPA